MIWKRKKCPCYLKSQVLNLVVVWKIKKTLTAIRSYFLPLQTSLVPYLISIMSLPCDRRVFDSPRLIQLDCQGIWCALLAPESHPQGVLGHMDFGICSTIYKITILYNSMGYFFRYSADSFEPFEKSSDTSSSSSMEKVLF